MIQLVVSRYNENLDWLKDLPPFVEVAIYDKGHTTQLPPRGCVTFRPNTGREAETILNHIITRYNELADITAFVQGNPFDHCPNPLPLPIENSTLGNMGFLPPSPNESLKEYGFMPLVHPQHLAYTESDGAPGDRLPVGEFYTRIFNKQMPHHIGFVAGACFCVTRKSIHQHPKDFYQRVLGTCEYEYPETYPFLMERMWLALFVPESTK